MPLAVYGVTSAQVDPGVMGFFGEMEQRALISIEKLDGYNCKVGFLEIYNDSMRTYDFIYVASFWRCLEYSFDSWPLRLWNESCWVEINAKDRLGHMLGERVRTR